jgi:glutaredoxin|tara:strand:+ start:6030 stop:6299 length:270 start_codon:yes stop_codon:yes gene_type:complete
MEIIIYSLESCPHCVELKEMLEDEGLSFKVKDIDVHKKEWEQIREHTKVDYVPTVLMVDKENKTGSVIAPDRDYDELTECVQKVKNKLL